MKVLEHSIGRVHNVWYQDLHPDGRLRWHEDIPDQDIAVGNILSPAPIQRVLPLSLDLFPLGCSSGRRLSCIPGLGRGSLRWGRRWLRTSGRSIHVSAFDFETLKNAVHTK